MIPVRTFWPVLAWVLFLPACLQHTERASEPSPPSANDQSVGAVLWFQSSAEAQALYYQGYHLARIRLSEELRNKQAAPLAVVVDIDETVLDNSPHQARLIRTNRVFPAFWDEWIDRADARALPGAVEFLRFADSNRVAVFYVSNRDERMLGSTMKNLERCGFPQVKAEHFFLQTKESSKAERRRRIAEGYSIVLLIGDNMNDFSEVFEGKSPTERSSITHGMKDRFGEKFIILPNPAYGDWENAVFGYRRGLSVADKNRLRIEALQGF